MLTEPLNVLSGPNLSYLLSVNTGPLFDNDIHSCGLPVNKSELPLNCFSTVATWKVKSPAAVPPDLMNTSPSIVIVSPTWLSSPPAN